MSARRTLFSNSEADQGRALHVEQLLIALLTDERAILLEGRNRHDAAADFLVARA